MKILIIEDEKRMADTLARGISEENHVVTVAYDGREGLEFASSSNFDVNVLDGRRKRAKRFKPAGLIAFVR